MIKTARQLKDLIRNLSKKNAADAQVLMRNYMMERFLERISLSSYRDKFILKGGMLVAAMVGLDARVTMTTLFDGVRTHRLKICVQRGIGGLPSTSAWGYLDSHRHRLPVLFRTLALPDCNPLQSMLQYSYHISLFGEDTSKHGGRVRSCSAKFVISNP